MSVIKDLKKQHKKLETEIKKITEDENNFKLRRYGNDIFRKN